MRLKVPPLKRLALVILVLVPIVAWMVVRPVRVIAPKYAGVTCLKVSVCVEDLLRLDDAIGLYVGALRFVAERVAPLEGTPRMIFCSTQACADYFGLGKRSAVTLGTFGTVIGPRAWQPHYVRHELIHYTQCQRLGMLTLLRKPAWFVEGMAYALSDDPRHPLAEPFDEYRRRFLSWYAPIGMQDVWQQAREL